MKSIKIVKNKEYLTAGFTLYIDKNCHTVTKMPHGDSVAYELCEHIERQRIQLSNKDSIIKALKKKNQELNKKNQELTRSCQCRDSENLQGGMGSKCEKLKVKFN